MVRDFFHLLVASADYSFPVSARDWVVGTGFLCQELRLVADCHQFGDEGGRIDIEFLSLVSPWHYG